MKIPIENILFAEVYNRKVVIHTREGNVEYYGKLADLEREIPAVAKFVKNQNTLLIISQ